MIELSNVYFIISIILLLVSIRFKSKINPEEKGIETKLKSTKKAYIHFIKFRKSYLQHLMKQLNFSLETQIKETELKNIKSLLPKLNVYSETVIPSFTIVYATQSNTSKRFAEKIQSDSKTLKLKAVIKNISEITIKDFETNLLMVFLISTYGEGGPSDDCIEFDKFLDQNKNGIKKDNAVYLNELNYSIFGLGSRKYEHFNAMALKLEKIMNKSGCIKYYFKLL